MPRKGPALALITERQEKEEEDSWVKRSQMANISQESLRKKAMMSLKSLREFKDRFGSEGCRLQSRRQEFEQNKPIQMGSIKNSVKASPRESIKSIKSEARRYDSMNFPSNFPKMVSPRVELSMARDHSNYSGSLSNENRSN